MCCPFNMPRYTFTVDLEHDGTGRPFIRADQLQGIIIHDPELRQTAVGPAHTHTAHYSEDGTLLVCNVPMRKLIQDHTFVDAVALVLDGQLPDGALQDRVAARLRGAMTMPEPHVAETLMGAAMKTPGLERQAPVVAELLLIMARSYTRRFLTQAGRHRRDSMTSAEVERVNRDICLEVTGLMAPILATAFRADNHGAEAWLLPREADLDGSYAANLACLMFGDQGSCGQLYEGTVEALVFDALLTITIDGGQNAAITAAEIAASADDRGNNPLAVQAVAVITRSGNLHGGACRSAYQELAGLEREIRSTGLCVEKAVEVYIQSRYDNGAVLYGFGTRRINRSGLTDPRASLLSELIESYGIALLEGRIRSEHLPNERVDEVVERTFCLLTIAKEVEQQAAEGKIFGRPLQANYDLYSGILLGLSGVAPKFVPDFMFAGRATSVMQHVRQFVEENGHILSPEMLVRPGSRSSIL